MAGVVNLRKLAAVCFKYDPNSLVHGVFLEKIAGRLGRTVVASERFAGICDGGWSDLGEFPIAGFAKAARVYGLFDEMPGAVAG